MKADVCESVPYLAESEIKILVGGTDENLAQIPLYDFCEGESEYPKYRKRLWASPAIATAQALTNVRGRLIPARVIKRLVAESPAYQKTEFCLFTLRYSSLLSSFGTEEIAVKNSDIAERLSASRNVINRVLQD